MAAAGPPAAGGIEKFRVAHRVSTLMSLVASMTVNTRSKSPEDHHGSSRFVGQAHFLGGGPCRRTSSRRLRL
jgi:hypothetical protein